jgi:two-component system, LytTR family, response regulator LytT
MKIKCIAIDDEPLALQQINKYILRTPFLECTALCKSAFEAMEYLTLNSVDLMFVDINMPDFNGLDFIKSLRQKPLVVFTTAYSEYAFEGFKVDAIDYLLKPVTYIDFLKAANKARQWFEINQKPIEPEPVKTDKVLFVKSEHMIVKVPIQEIMYVESANEYIKIVLDNKEVITTLIRLKEFGEQLPENQFMRIHRSFIVNLGKIKAIERNKVILISNIPVPIGDLYRESFQAYADKVFKV